MTGVELIAQERQRQVQEEGWTAEHDKQHQNGELAMAAACYSLPRTASFVVFRGKDGTPSTFDPWPWYRDYFRYSDGPAVQVPAWDKRNKHLLLAFG
ncbi:MAG: hypothetical protein PHV74_13865 [Dehalococcoidia bacterium]|nr:hypothetical protein [Dehalococcoidia bacterium]